MELGTVTAELEACLQKCFSYQKINYLMLMMVDPDVHFHVLPRYESNQVFSAVEFSDPGWPALPELGHATSVNDDVMLALLAHLKQQWS